MQLKINKNWAFTLIEFLIVVTIFFLLIAISYIPYNFYMNKARVKTSIREISQSLYEARNMAINGVSSGSNLSIWLYLDAQNNSNNLQFFSYPYSFSGTDISNEISSDIKLIKTYKLLPNINILDIDWKDNWLFFFESITGSGSYYYWENNTKNEITNNEIKINISYNGAVIWTSLFWELTYFTNTNIVDY